MLQGISGVFQEISEVFQRFSGGFRACQECAKWTRRFRIVKHVPEGFKKFHKGSSGLHGFARDLRGFQER